MTKQEIKALVDLAKGAFPKTPNDELIKIGKSWEETIDLPFRQALLALKRVLRTSQYWPTVAEILAAAGDIKEEQDRQVFNPGVKSSCPNCEGYGRISIIQDGEERYGRCPCVAGEQYSSWPMAPAWAIVSDGKMKSSGEEVKGVEW